MKRFGWIGLFWAGVASCASPQAVDDTWPAPLPPRAYYERIWDLDPANQELETRSDYLGWVKSFYRGSALAGGWIKTENELLAGLGPAEYSLVAPKIRCLGELVSAEWAKDNRCRKIGSPLLVLWGRAMAEAKRRGQMEVLLDLILADVRSLLRAELRETLIRSERYRDPEPRTVLVRPP